MIEKIKNIFKINKPTSNIKSIALNISRESNEFYEERRKARGLDEEENLRIETETKQIKQFKESLEQFKKDRAKTYAKQQEFYKQRKKERGYE